MSGVTPHAEWRAGKKESPSNRGVGRPGPQGGRGFDWPWKQEGARVLEGPGKNLTA